MKKNIFNHSFLVLMLIILSAIKSYAQNTDSIQHRIIIVPFQPEYYLSDAEQDIMKQTHKTPDEYRAYFRRVLDLKIEAALSTELSCISFMQDTSKSVRESMLDYYSNEGLKYDFPVETKIKSKDKTEPASKEIYGQHNAPQYATVQGDAKFMNTVINDTSFYRKLLSQYNADYLLSVNQFEIKTNYKSCIDIANRVYRRELMIHYSLIDSNGKVILGNFITAYFPSDSNHDTEIAERVFPEIAAKMKASVSEILK